MRIAVCPRSLLCSSTLVLCLPAPAGGPLCWTCCSSFPAWLRHVDVLPQPFCFVSMSEADRVWSQLSSPSSALPWEVFLDRSCLSMPSTLDFHRPDHVPEPPPAQAAPPKKPRVETFSAGGSVALKVCVKPWHDEDRRSTALFQLQSIVVAWPDGFGIVRLCTVDHDLDLGAVVQHRERLQPQSHQHAGQAIVQPYPLCSVGVPHQPLPVPSYRASCVVVPGSPGQERGRLVEALRVYPVHQLVSRRPRPLRGR